MSALLALEADGFPASPKVADRHMDNRGNARFIGAARLAWHLVKGGHTDTIRASDIALCALGTRLRMGPLAVQRSFRRDLVYVRGLPVGSKTAVRPAAGEVAGRRPHVRSTAHLALRRETGCPASSSSARRINRTASGIEKNCETRCSFVHRRSPASAKAGDRVKSRRAIVRNQVHASTI